MLHSNAIICIFLLSMSPGYGWTGRNVPKRTVSSVRKEFPLAEGREPAGVEVVFAKAKNLRKSELAKVVEKAKPGTKITWLLPGGKRKKQKRKAAEEPLQQQHGKGHVGKEEILSMRAEISLPQEWEFRSDKEIDALSTMKILLQNEFEELKQKEVRFSSGKVANVIDAFPDVYGDIRLLRFLRKQTEEDPLAASMSYRKFLRWRERKDIDNIRLLVEDELFKVPPELKLVSDFLPCNFNTEDSTFEEGGSPVLISLYIGKWKTGKITSLVQNEEEFSLEDFLDYWTFMFESLHRKLYEESIKQQKMVFADSISDLKGFSLQQLSPAFVNKVLRPWIHHLQSHYPETAERINVCNPPKVLSLLWKLVIPMIRPGTVAKIRIH